MTILITAIGLALSVVISQTKAVEDFVKPYRDQVKAITAPYVNAVLTYGTGTPELRRAEEQRP